jgi:hypothetical protein
MQIGDDKLRALVVWSEAYEPEWDGEPERYVDVGVVGWAKSRRLGLLKVGAVKAYIGVQHIDPARPGWNIVERPQARFFVSFFVEAQCVALRTASTLDAALALLRNMLQSAGVRL